MVGETADNLPQYILDVIDERSRTRQAWEKTRNPKFRTLFYKQTKIIKLNILKHRNKSWQNKLEKLNPNDTNVAKKQSRSYYPP